MMGLMNMDNDRRCGSSSGQVRRRVEVEDDLIQIPKCYMIAASDRFKQIINGRMLNREGRSLDAIIGFLPKTKIWDVEGRVQGLNLGNGQFQFDFDKEEDMNKVLAKRR